jgi:hypothetical protein
VLRAHPESVMLRVRDVPTLHSMDVGPVELIVLVFPSERADAAVVSAISEVVARGDVTVLDLIYLARTADGQVRLVDVDENLDEVGLGSLQVMAQALVSEDDLEVLRDELDPGTSAAVIVYEHSWARRVAAAVQQAGGRVALHIQVPRDTVEAAMVAAATS